MTSGPKGSDAPPTRATPAPAAANSCGGTLALGAIASCPGISGREVHRYKITTTRDRERLSLVLHHDGDHLSAELTGPDGERVCVHFIYNLSCVAAAAGTYTIRVEVTHGNGAAAYALGADSRDAPSECPRLDPATFTFPLKPHAGKLAAGAAFRCHLVDQPAGTRMRLAISEGPADVRGTLVDAAGEDVCHLQDDRECKLEGPGPYRALLTELYGNPADYRFTVTRLSDPVGCTEIPLAGFGAAATRSAPGEVEQRGGLTCHTVTATAGNHYIDFSGDTQHIDWSLVDGDGNTVCSRWGEHEHLCPLPADGRYSVYTTSRDDFDRKHEYRVAVHPLAVAQGCAGQLSTAWNAPAAQVTPADPLQMDCWTLDAEPGERIRLDADDAGREWLTDATGADICAAVRDWEQDGCLLPGSGPYRIVTTAEATANGEPRPYTVTARRLSQPHGCETVTPGRFGAPAAGAATANGCRLLTVPAAGAYIVEAANADDERTTGTVYDAAGRKVCNHTGYCTFPAAGTYTLVVRDDEPMVTVLLPRTGTDGCTPVSDKPTAKARTIPFQFPGQYHCLLLPTPAGAGVTMLEPQDSRDLLPGMTVVDARGEYVCETYGLRQGSCVLEGDAPFRVLVNRDESDVPPTFVASFASPRDAGCPGLPRTAFGAAPGATVTLAGEAFVSCWTIPAGQFTGTEMYGFRRTAGTGVARLSVFAAKGERQCDLWTTDAGLTLCTPGTGPWTVLLQGSAATATFEVYRRDVGATAQGCGAVTSTVVGGPAVAGTSAPRGDARCHRVTANALDRFLIDTRDARGSTRVLVTDQNGEEVRCAGRIGACPVNGGGTTYQVLVIDLAPTGTTPYRLDVWKTSVAGRLPAECSPVANNAYGFGPFTGTLNDTRTGLCLATTVRSLDDFSVEVLNLDKPEGGTDFGFDLWTVAGNGARLCFMGGDFSCRVVPESRIEPVLFVLSPGSLVGDLRYRLEAKCTTPFCGGHEFGATGVAPAALANGGKRTFTVRGSTLHLQDTVEVSVGGGPALTAKVTSVSTDRSTLTAEVDLTSAPLGKATVIVRSFTSGVGPARLADALVITAPGMTATAPPSITGTAAAGETVKATTGSWTPTGTSYAYQWSANGVAISGATAGSYQIPASVVGKKLTVTVTAKRAGHPDGVATSSAATVAKGKAPKATAKPKITGTARVGRTVRASAGTWSPAATSYAYEWRLNGAVVRGAGGSSLRLTSSMRNKRLTVTVIAKRTGHADGNASSASVTVRR